MTSKVYTLDRQQASDLLKVSVRTIDRYITKKVLSSQRRQGRIYLNEEEIKHLQLKANIDTIDGAEVMSTSKKSSSNYVDHVESDQKKKSSSSSSSFAESRQEIDTASISVLQTEARIYRELFDASQKKIEEQNGQLLQSWKKIAELQGELKNSVPLLAMENRQKEEDQSKITLEKRLQHQEFFKNLYLVLLIGAGVLLPFLLFVLR